MLKKLLLLFHTIRFLKPIQLYWRLYLKINQLFSFSVDIKEPVRTRNIDLIHPITKYSSLFNEQFHFLNEYGVAKRPIAWNQEKMSKLWLYNLHYFDYLNQDKIDKLFALDLMQDWVKQNPVGIGNGWEPYPISLRIVNWIKFLSRSDLKNILLYDSLFLQARFLYKHLEYHLLGNHLFKNGVALLFAGGLFEGKEAESWVKEGRQIVIQQIREQVLADGGHFERSPMYHVLILEDILDCLNLNQAISCFTLDAADCISTSAAAMQCFLSDILHPDGEIPFFNDSAINIAPSPLSIIKYANDLGIEFNQPDNNNCIEKPDFGFIIFQNQMSKMIFDVGAIGPDYLPGHAHCDSLSYELSLGGERCIVNSGTFQYAGEERNVFRATEAHNTVKIDDIEQHEIWSTFRVARRAYPLGCKVTKVSKHTLDCSVSLSGYLSSQIVHTRSVSFQKDQLIIEDLIHGSGLHEAKSFIHLHPEVKLVDHSAHVLHCKRENILFSIQALDGEIFDINKSYYSPGFGLKIENIVLVICKQAESPFSFGYRVSY